MDTYHVWCDLKEGVGDLDFAQAVTAWMEHLASEETISGWRLSRRKLGLGPADLGEFHLAIDVRDLAQLDRAFQVAASRAQPAEGLHHGVNSLVRNPRFALYRDFPDDSRRHGEELF
jgi:hypothetical protein